MALTLIKAFNSAHKLENVIRHPGNSHAKKRCKIESSCLKEPLSVTSRFPFGNLTCFGKMSFILITSVFLDKEAPVNAPAGTASQVPFFQGLSNSVIKIGSGHKLVPTVVHFLACLL